MTERSYGAAFKQFNQSDWEDYYADPERFGELFSDYLFLRDAARHRYLSSSERARYRACIEMIEGRMSD